MPEAKQGLSLPVRIPELSADRDVPLIGGDRLVEPAHLPVLDLYDHPPADGRVVCVDEFGPLNLLPRTGKAWRLLRRPRRLRATYTRTAGVMHMLAALDLATGRLFYRIRPRKRWTEFLDLLKALSVRWPGEKLYVVCDDFSPHHHARSRPGARPTPSSWCSCRPTGPG